MSGLGSRGWKEFWFWKGGPSRRLRSGEVLQRTEGTPGRSSLTSRLCCNTGFRATAIGGMAQVLFSPFSGSRGPGLEGSAGGAWPGERKKASRVGSKTQVLLQAFEYDCKLLKFLSRRLGSTEFPSNFKLIVFHITILFPEIL